MKVAITGATGFIGKSFIQNYGTNFTKIIELHSKNAPLQDKQALADATQECDILIHTAFDHSYKQNIVGIKNILQVCKENGIKKLIYLSTVSVYDPDIQDDLDENSPYSKINDPYSKEKRKIEKIIDDFDKTFDVVVLQPTVVYGVGGNWTKYALHVCKSKAVRLPNDGNGICNSIYVDDVAYAIYQSCISDIKYEKILISSEPLSWKEFYQKQCEILKILGLPSSCNVENNSSKNEFHSNNLINFIFTLWFKTPFGNIFDMVIGFLKDLRAKNYKDVSSQEALKSFLQSEVDQNILEPSGITKKVHSAKFEVDTTKAKKLLNFIPSYSFNKATEDMKQKIQEALK